MKLLLFGGTFDPPHYGHINNLRAAMAAVAPDRVLVMPAGTPPHKAASQTPAALRLEMCECFRELSPKIEVSDWEIRQGGRSYTVHTLTMLHKKCPDAALFLTIGSDMLLSFTTWHRWQEILRLATLVVESREHGDADALRKAAEGLAPYGGRVVLADAPTFPCASADIRSGKLAPERWRTFVPPEALAVMERENLYR